MRTVWIADSLMIFVIAAGCQAEDTGIKLKVVEGRPIVSDVWLDGVGPFQFLLDTGAQTNQIHPNVARRLALTPTFQVELATVAGVSMVAGTRIREIRVGAARTAQQEILFTSLNGIRSLSDKIDGVLGQEFLRNFDYLLDMSGRNIVFGSRAFSERQAAFRLVAGRMAVETGRGPLILDSGTNALVLFGKRTPFSSGVSSFVQTALGNALASAVQAVTIRLGERDYRLTAAYVDHCEEDAEGLLPVGQFRAIYVSNSGRYVIFDPTL